MTNCSIVSDHCGCVNAVTIYARDISFMLVFGLPGSETGDDSKNGILCAIKSVRALKGVPGVLGLSVGISTGEFQRKLKVRFLRLYI